jgi:hypothetical protein
MCFVGGGGGTYWGDWAKSGKPPASKPMAAASERNLGFGQITGLRDEIESQGISWRQFGGVKHIAEAICGPMDFSLCPGREFAKMILHS